ncbi:hypothetical protein J6590_014116 [Homalodisca vitripennis]|nr:hypothetical protein J6590_014116 [Homalodisca vitripennis]
MAVDSHSFSALSGLSQASRLDPLLFNRFGYGFIEAPVTELEELFDLQPSPLTHRCTDLQFLFNLVNGLIDCPNLLNGIDFSQKYSLQISLQQVFSKLQVTCQTMKSEGF